MSKGTIPIILLLLSFTLAGCSTKSDDATTRSNNTPDGSNTKQTDSKTRTQQDSLTLRNAVVECLNRKGFTGQVLGIGVVDYLGDLFSGGSIVAVETSPQMFGSSLIYLLVCPLEDKDGNGYPHAEFLTAKSGDIALLLANKKHANNDSSKD